jgi:acyl-CoA thioesterase-1
MKKTIQFALVLILASSRINNVANAKLVACVGDSITYGSGISDRQNDSYPAQLSRMLQKFDSQWQAQNFGVSGATLLSSGDLPYVRQIAYNQALTAEPDAVIIMLGTNDSKSWNWVYKDDFVSDYILLIDAFAELPSKPKIWICKPVPAFSDNFGITNSVIKDEIIPMIDQIAELRDVEVIDLYTPMLNTSSMFPDGIHPNADGARLMAEAIFPLSTPDLNEDGIVNAADMCIIIDHWGENYFLYDVGPAPFGDDIIDVQDLVLLSEYLFTYPGAVAYWKLDETEGDIAHDSVYDCNGTLIGEPLWRLTGGIVAGALQFDGVDDYISTDFVLNPEEGAFSAFAWIKGGTPGQVVLSQMGKANWFSSDPSEGKFITELVPPTTRSPLPPLVSETRITDGNWHHIGFVWDGSHRTLYVDDVMAAEDVQKNMASSNNGLYIDADKNLDAGTFFSGLIDDVRIYNVALFPAQIAAPAQ